MGKHKDIKRKLIQLYSALLYNAHIRGFAEGQIFTGNTKAVCVPGFNCYSCPGAVGACPLGSLQNALGSLNKSIGFYVFGILLLYGMLFGRTVCGWLCPLGLIQELLHKIPTFKIKKSRFTRLLSYLKYVILVIFVVIIPVYYGIFQKIPVPGFCKFICPAGTGEGAMGLLPKNTEWLSMLGPIFTEKFVILVIVGLACIFCYRSFCRFLCPLGAIYGFFNSIAVIGVKVDKGRCNNCKACVRNCKMDVLAVGDHECIQCGECVAVCAQGALSRKAGKIELPLKKRWQVIGWTVAVIALAGVIVWTNFLDPSLNNVSASEEDDQSAESYIDDHFYVDEDGDVFYVDDEGYIYNVDEYGNYFDAGYDQDQPEAGDSEEDYDEDQDYYETSEYDESDAPVGYDVGDRLADFEVTCFEGSTFSISENRGKVVFINLWATYCGPCVKELPDFIDLYRQHEDEMAFLAVHSNLTVEDVGQYVQDKGWDAQFAVDDDDNTIFNTVNGSTALPQTIVLNRRGEVIYNKVGSVSADMLRSLFDEAVSDDTQSE